MCQDGNFNDPFFNYTPPPNEPTVHSRTGRRTIIESHTFKVSVSEITPLGNHHINVTNKYIYAFYDEGGGSSQLAAEIYVSGSIQWRILYNPDLSKSCTQRLTDSTTMINDGYV